MMWNFFLLLAFVILFLGLLKGLFPKRFRAVPLVLLFVFVWSAGRAGGAEVESLLQGKFREGYSFPLEISGDGGRVVVRL